MAIPFHIKGSRVQYKTLRGTKFIWEEVTRPCDLKDSDYTNKELLFESFRQIAMETLRIEIAQSIQSYFSRATLMYIISDLNHRVIAFTITGTMFESGHFVMIQWLNMCLDKYRVKGITKACIPKAFLHSVKEYNRIQGNRGIKRLIPFFKESYMIFRTVSPIVYYAAYNSPMKISPPINPDGTMNLKNISDREIKIRKDYLVKLGYKENEINDRSIFVIRAFTDELGNRAMLASTPDSPVAALNIFFKNNLRVDQGNALIALVHCRPAPAMALFFPLRFLKSSWRKIRDIMKSLKNLAG